MHSPRYNVLKRLTPMMVLIVSGVGVRARVCVFVWLCVWGVCVCVCLCVCERVCAHMCVVVVGGEPEGRTCHCFI